jgi:N-acylneuraminate cytidylyltransferase
MIDGKSVLGLILARGGSKGLPRKNVRELYGKPLVAWTVKSALSSDYIDRLVLSSDDVEIMRAAAKYGCEIPFRRPDKLAEDDTPTTAARIHAMNQVPDQDYTVLLQPTSPLRTAEDIDGAIRVCRNEAPACLSITKADKPPHWMYSLDSDNRLNPILDHDELVSRRQDAPATYVLNGAVYVAETEWLRNEGTFLSAGAAGYPMPKERSADIDTSADLAWCEFMMQQRFEG